MPNYKITKGSMTGHSGHFFNEGDVITEQDLVKNGVGLRRAKDLGVIKEVEEKRSVKSEADAYASPEIEVAAPVVAAAPEPVEIVAPSMPARMAPRK
jgi:hypothetical protein